MRAIFRMRGNENQPGLWPVKRLATPLVGKNMWERQPGLLVSTSSSVSTQMESTPPAQPSKNTPRPLATSSHWTASARILTRRKNLVARKIRETPSRFTKGTRPLMLRLCCSVSCHVTKVVAWLNMDACTLIERQSCCLINLTVLLSFNLYLSCKFIFQ